MSDKMRSIGKVKDAHSLQGELFIIIFSEDISWSDKLQKAMLQLDSQQMQLQIGKIKAHKNGIILKSPQITDRTQAEKWKGALLLVSEDLFISKPGENIYLTEILGFDLYNGKNKVGVVESFQNYGAHDILVVRGETQAYDIPFVKAYTEDIDFAGRAIYMNLPEGLLTINDAD